MCPSIVVMIVSLLSTADGLTSAMDEEIKKLHGTWTVVRARRDGETDKELLEATVVMSDGKFVSKSGTKIMARGVWNVDPHAKPKTIDIEYTEGPEKGHVVRGIYTFAENTWVVLLAAPGASRPVSFKADSDTGHTFLVLKSAKP
jgi:uncharacterized protein (TIGR03067 family)